MPGSRPPVVGKLDVSVIIPSYGDRGHLGLVLRALTEQKFQVAEVIVSHSGEGDPTQYIPESSFPIRVIHSDSRLFAGAARNAAVAQSVSTWIAFIDDDVVPALDWSSVVAELVATNNAADLMVGSIDTQESEDYWGLCLWFMEFGSVHPYMPSRVVEGGAGANMLIARSLFHAADGFSETERADDIELVARVFETGARTVFIPNLVVSHFEIPGLEHNRAHAGLDGSGSARARVHFQLRGSFFARHPALTHLLVPIRLIQMSYRIARWGKNYRWIFLKSLPGITYLLIYWCGGFKKFIIDSRVAQTSLD